MTTLGYGFNLRDLVVQSPVSWLAPRPVTQQQQGSPRESPTWRHTAGKYSPKLLWLVSDRWIGLKLCVHIKVWQSYWCKYLFLRAHVLQHKHSAKYHFLKFCMSFQSVSFFFIRTVRTCIFFLSFCNHHCCLLVGTCRSIFPHRLLSKLPPPA